MNPHTGRDFVQFGKTESVLNKGAKKIALLFNPPPVLSLVISSTMAHMSNEFNGMQDTLESTENGALLLEINNILKTHRMATDTDVDKILAGMYVEEDEESSIFEIGSFQDIDDILSGTYMDTEK